MYGLELRIYMLTSDSDGTLEPVSRISRWEDKDNDGIYETVTPFVDNLVFPRFVLPYARTVSSPWNRMPTMYISTRIPMGTVKPIKKNCLPLITAVPAM